MSGDGVFITFEGIEGTGKTTQIRRLAEFLRGRGLDPVLTREPGGCPIADEIRAILLSSRSRRLCPEAELQLIWAARAQHVDEVVRPALEAGRVVLCDRFGDATEAYQGFARGLGVERVREGNRFAAFGLTPALTIWLDLPLDVGLSRARTRESAQADEVREDRFESEAREFHGAVREGYRLIAEREPERVARVDATGTPDEVEARIRPIVARKLGIES
jgi:dTMP kinase